MPPLTDLLTPPVIGADGIQAAEEVRLGRVQ